MISFVVLCKNEGEYLRRLIPNIEKFMKDEDELIIVDDHSDESYTVNYLNSLNRKVYLHKLNGDFSSHRNFAHQHCKNEYIFMIDADELISDVLGENLHDIIKANPDVDLFSVPRLNVVEGMTDQDVNKWGWRKSTPDGFDKEVINWPDYQGRIYKNKESIKWKGKLHERVDGFSIRSEIPALSYLSLIHVKSIKRQTSQNEFYNKNFTEKENRGIHT